MLYRDSTCDTPLRNLVHNHSIEDRLHHLGDVGVLSVPCGHAEVETQAEDKVILRGGLGRWAEVSLKDHRRVPRAYLVAILVLVKSRK